MPTVQQVRLSDIEVTPVNELSTSKLHSLENGYDSFEHQLNSRNNPIALSGSRPPYHIIDGRHRIHLCRKKGYHTILAIFI